MLVEEAVDASQTPYTVVQFTSAQEDNFRHISYHKYRNGTLGREILFSRRALTGGAKLHL